LASLAAEESGVATLSKREAQAGIDGHITKPIRFGDIENPPTSFPAALSAVPAGSSAKLLWDKVEALDRLGGDEQLLRELCQIFLEESPKLLRKLRQAIIDEDANALMRAAHNLKGELGYLGAVEASQAAQKLEDMGHENDLSQAAETLAVLEGETASLHVALKDPAGAIQ
jgi:two-component system sensor histidine kinase/response regulator